ncbi:hypothetical protein AB4099_33400 [Bosea sp. 2KB_26]|uniref:hypothetical protein n=1 Tax=Bosea sp. 2KB_26 TaxID=3237475 RepID=UPI003F915022
MNAMTPIQKRGLTRLMLRLPGLRDGFEQTSDEIFFDICEAYELAWIGLDFWTRSEAPERAERIMEYEELAASLESEALIRGRKS